VGFASIVVILPVILRHLEKIMTTGVFGEMEKWLL
jgi:hypothetical protein